MANECPKCKAHMKPLQQTCKCGFEVSETVEPRDPHCAWIENGNRCEELGTISPSTTEGKSYCRPHYRRVTA